MSRASSEDRLVFLLSLIAYLKRHEGATVNDLAKHFGMKPAEIRDTISTLTTFGVPSDDYHYYPDDYIDIDWESFEQDESVSLRLPQGIQGDAPRLSSSEGAVIIAGLNYLKNVPGLADTKVVDALLQKIQAGAESTGSEMVISDSSALHEKATIAASIAAGTKLSISYVAVSGAVTERIVDPLLLQSLDAAWYLRAWCSLAEDVRLFRLDRIQSITPLTDPISAQSAQLQRRASAEELSFFQAVESGQDIVLRVTPGNEELLWSFQPTAQGEGLFSIRVAQIPAIRRIIAANPGSIELVRSDEARQSIADWAEAALRLYDDNNQ